MNAPRDSEPRPRLWVDPAQPSPDPSLRRREFQAIASGGLNGVRWSVNPGAGGLVVRSRSAARRRRNELPLEVLLSLVTGTADGGRVLDLALEVTDSTVAQEVIERARLAGLMESLWIISGDVEVLKDARAGSPATRLLHACDPAKQPRGAESHAATLRAESLEGVLMPCERISAGPVVLMHRFARLVAVDGISYQRHLERAREAGADVLCGNDAAVLTATG